MAIASGVFTLLSQSGLIDEELITSATVLINQENLSVIAALAKVRPELSPLKIMLVLSDFYGIPLLDLDAFNREFIPKNILPIEYLLRHKVLPLGCADKRLKLAVVDPTNKELLAEIRFKTSLALDLILVEESKLEDIIRQSSPNYFKTIQLDEEALQGIELADGADDRHDMVNSADDDQPIVKFVHKMIFDAVQRGASDIHFEPYEKSYRVRYRIDGVLCEVATPPQSIKDKVAARIKVVAKLDITEKRVPQDGRLRLRLAQNQIIDFRVSTLPTAYGEKIVLRILDRQTVSLEITALGLEDEQQKILIASVSRPYGMVLVTGPTGSGKTVTLYSCLNLLNNASRNISTAEDPIEIPLLGINQVAINDKTGLNFAVALRAFLRQDPDVIMVGEIRDHETADIALKAAQTGHLVLSTLHTNDAASALIRLVNMGVPSYNVGDAILAIVAQRLVRKLCPQCKDLAAYAKNVLLAAGFGAAEVKNGWQPFVARGCYACHGTGYQGRIGVFEVMPISQSLKRLILRNVTSLELANQARQEGVLSLRQSGLQKVQSGLSSLAEIEATINE